MLELRSISKLYSGIPAVDGVSFEARPGEVTGYLGANGSGKSTTMKIITGLLAPSGGEVLFEGRPGLGGLDGFPATYGVCAGGAAPVSAPEWA